MTPNDLDLFNNMIGNNRVQIIRVKVNTKFKKIINKHRKTFLNKNVSSSRKRIKVNIVEK